MARDVNCARSHRCYGCAVRSSRRSGAILIVVLAIMIAVAVLASQGLRLMMFARSSHETRQKSAQMNELLELGKLRLTDLTEPTKITVEVPSQNGLPAKPALIEIDKTSDSEPRWRINVRFPFHQPGEATVSWESPT